MLYCFLYPKDYGITALIVAMYFLDVALTKSHFSLFMLS